MKPHNLIAAAALLIVACGDAQEPASEMQSATRLESAQPATEQPESSQAAEAGEDQPLDLAQTEAAASAPAAARFQLGRHYQRLSPTQPTSSGPEQIEVAEVFWYGCPHCYTFEPYLGRWRASKPDYVSFVRIPAVWNPLVRMHARAFYTAETLDMVEQVHGEIFRAIHEDGNALDSEAALRQFFGRFGVDAESFQRAFDSFAVHTKLQRADELARRYRVTSVPMVVVNGKYTTDASSAGGYDRLLEVIDELTGLEATRAQ